MTLTASTPHQSASSLLSSPPALERSGESLRHARDGARGTATIDVAMFRVLLEEPAIALWAAEAAAKYQVSALGALGLLAHALLVDGEHAAAQRAS